VPLLQDARAASIVMRGMKRVALSGRAVVATIHQPSIVSTSSWLLLVCGCSVVSRSYVDDVYLAAAQAIFNSFDTLLLLKRGGEVVFHGELGHESAKLISYFERYSATRKIKPGENPATWMLTVIGAGSSANARPFDYAGNYVGSRLHQQNLEKIERLCSNPTDGNRVRFPGIYATSIFNQSNRVLERLLKVYWRSPSYNLVRVLVAMFVALLFSSVYITSRVPENESDMNSRVTTIFIASIFLGKCHLCGDSLFVYTYTGVPNTSNFDPLLLFFAIGVNAFNTVLAVFETERNMFYRHKAALMYDQKALIMSFTFAELPFIVLVSFVFVVLFYFIMGFAKQLDKFFYFLMFFCLAQMVFTYCGQMFSALLRDSMTAQGAGGLFISMTVLFTGVLIRPSEIPDPWIFMYWVSPGHYIYEGLIMTQFVNDDTEIVASPGSPFFQSLGCTDARAECIGTAEQWVETSFDAFSYDHVPYNLIYLLAIVLFSRFVTYMALTHLNYRNT